MLFISNAYAQEAAATGQPDLIANLLPLIIIFVIFYFLLIRPQHKKIQAHGELVKGITRGNEVLTSGGIIGKVTKTEDDILYVEIATDVVVRVKRSTVTDVVTKKAKEAEEKKPAKKGKAKK